MSDEPSICVAGEGAGVRLMQLGAIVFLLGLLSGFVTGAMDNPRLGLSAHLQGMTNGTFLLAAGAVWGQVRLPAWLKRIAFWMFAVGTTANWLTVQLAAIWGAGLMMPIAAPGYEAETWQETIVSAGLIGVALTMTIGAVLFAAGLLRAVPTAARTAGRGPE